MKIILFLIFSLSCYSQELVGVWKNDEQAETALEFKSDGTFVLIDLKNSNEKVLKNMTITYRTLEKDGVLYIEYEYYKKGHPPETDLVKYKIENGILYLPTEKIINGKRTVEDYKDKYIRIR